MKKNFLLFLGMAVTILLTYFNYTILQNLKDSLLISQVNVELIPHLKMKVLPLTLFSGVLLIFLAWNGRIDRAFKVFFPLNILIYSAFALAPSIMADFIPLFYIWAHVSLILSVVLIWGYANQVYTFNNAAIQYPILAFIFINLGLLLPKYLPITMSPEIGFGLLALASLVIFAIYLGLYRLEQTQDQLEGKAPWSYWLWLGLVVFSIKFAMNFPEFVFKAKAVKHTLYPLIMDSKSVYAVYTGITGVIFGIIIYIRGAKALAKVLGAIALGVLFIGMSLFDNDFENGPLKFGLLFALFPLFQVFKELAFFGIEQKKRFTAKVLIDVIVYSIAAYASTMTNVFIKVLVPLESTPIFMVLFVAAMFIVDIGLYFINKRALTNKSLVGQE